MFTALIIFWVFAIGACIGSFLNVVIYRLPRDMSLIKPASHCTSCNTPLAWYDNIPVLGWFLLHGKCRYCRARISPRYPIVEAFVGFLFAFYYVLFFVAQVPGTADSWAMYFLDMALIAGLFAASVLDAELFIIPAIIPWVIGVAAIIVHGIFDEPGLKGVRFVSPALMSLSAGAGLGLIISIVLLQLGIFPLSFPEGDLLEHEREKLEQEEEDVPPEMTPSEIRREIRKEMLFLIPPMLLAGISLAMYQHVPVVANLWRSAAEYHWLNGALGSLLGGLVGGFVVWLFRIGGSYFFGREAMGLGDVHLMFGIGAVLGGEAAVVTLFLAALLALLHGMYMLIFHSRRQVQFGPYLSLAAAILMLCYQPIAAYLQPDVVDLAFLIRQLTGMGH